MRTAFKHREQQWHRQVGHTWSRAWAAEKVMAQSASQLVLPGGSGYYRGLNTYLYYFGGSLS